MNSLGISFRTIAIEWRFQHQLVRISAPSFEVATKWIFKPIGSMARQHARPAADAGPPLAPWAFAAQSFCTAGCRLWWRRD